MKRNRMSSSQSKKVFTKGAVLTHKKNTQGAPMRGGIRL